ncbi:hypothetical protein L2725_19430 [Shewanella corallii]|uniref:Uncharacterized protein n=1 Tax=Shewanella corallii TaxID=560080 RepID=A0ABT0NBV3_9GAMM|nr:hypothetical protein [Shewanella corallii]MCL2915918.1 hypothetical protein [Shewanella corallii]
MKTQLEAELAAVKKSMLMTQLIGLPGAIMLGLGVYGIFVEGEKFLPFLDDPVNCYGLLAVGALISMWEAMRVLQLNRRQQDIQSKLDTL